MRLVGPEKERKNDTPPARRTPPAPTGPGAEKATWLPKMPPGRTWLWLALVLAVNFWLARMLMPGPEAPVTIPYTLFREEVSEGQRPGDLQPWRHPHGALQDRGDLPAARSDDHAAPGPAPRSEGGVAARRAKAGDLLSRPRFPPSWGPVSKRS